LANDVVMVQDREPCTITGMELDDPIPALKQQLRDQLIQLISHADQFSAAGMLATDQPRISDLQRNRLDRFSLETLIRFLTLVECRVDVSVVRLSPALPKLLGGRNRIRRSSASKL
jgi:predicted XRE-type DNA-binding protein